MTTLVVPKDPRRGRTWPSLGGGICDFIEENLVFGPGDLLGEPAVLDDETRWLIWRLYEVYPRSHPHAGRRRFQRAALSLRKGLAKTEKAAWVAAAELHPEAPVRCDGFYRNEPIGRPVRDPYMPMLAYSLDQTEELAYGALKAILERSRIAGDFDITEERIKRIDGEGEALPVASAPSSRDGARTTWQHFDETHSLSLPRLVKAHQTMLLNLPKRHAADAWALETSTRYVPGESSVAEATEDYARQVQAGAIKDPRLFYFGRWASDKHDLDTEAGVRAAVAEASGPYDYGNTEAIVGLFSDPTMDRPMLKSRWLNMKAAPTHRAFDAEAWKKLADLEHRVPKGARIVAGFDGSRTDDWTSLTATELETGFQWPAGDWQPEDYGGEIPTEAVELAVDDLFTDYDVWRLYADPPKSDQTVAGWIGKYGKDRVVEWHMWRDRPVGFACRNFAEAITTGLVSHDGDERVTFAIGNAHKRYLNAKDDQDERLWTIQKERQGSPLKIDPAASAVLSWEARTDAIAAGASAPPKRSRYEQPGARMDFI